MNREISFRGKRVDNGEWVYGSIVHQTDYYGDKCDRWFILEGDCTNDYDIDYPIEVQKETVGQYTGLKDRNGKRIFEEDVIEYNGKRLVFKFLGKYSRFAPIAPNTVFAVFDYSRSEIIGNIHDNHELLRGETQ